MARNPLYGFMMLLAIATVVTGLVLLNPLTDTFASGNAWRAINGIRLGWFQPNESVWGTMFLAVGLNQLRAIISFRLALSAP